MRLAEYLYPNLYGYMAPLLLGCTPSYRRGQCLGRGDRYRRPITHTRPRADDARDQLQL
jgi:hypothetical protein